MNENKRLCRYVLLVEVPETDVRVLLDGIDGEPLQLVEALGDEVLREQIAAGMIVVDVSTEEPLRCFAHDVEVLSAYLAEPVIGTELVVEEHGATMSVRAWRVIGRGGEVVRVALDAVWTEEQTVAIGAENSHTLAEQLPAMPGWAQSLLAPRLASAAPTFS